MRRFAWVLGTILLGLTIVAVGCTPKAAPATTTPPKVSTVQGTVGDVNTQKSTVTVETAQGPQALVITPNTVLTLNGQACTLDQLDQLQAAGGDYNCAVVLDEDGNVLNVNVTSIPAPASARGTISDVNIIDSTVTVKTGTGDVVYNVDPDTGLLIGGVACSLALLAELQEAGAELPCTVIYNVDDTGTAQYIDVANPPNLTAGTGTIAAVDVEKSTVTITTDKGERTLEVNAKTGQFLNGAVCSLEDIQTAAEFGQLSPNCEVLYFTDEDGKLVYIDVTRTVNP